MDKESNTDIILSQRRLFFTEGNYFGMIKLKAERTSVLVRKSEKPRKQGGNRGLDVQDPFAAAHC